MDLETIKRINRDALRAAKEAQGESMSIFSEKIDNQMFLMYVLAVVVGFLAYYLLQRYSPAIVMYTENGQKVFDKTKAVIVSVIVSLILVVLYHLVY